MKKKLFGSVFLLGLMVVTLIKVNLSPSDSKVGLLLKNVEALANYEPGTGIPNACCKNGYKKWFTTTNIPTQRKESFKDCECNPQEGYDPQTCIC